MMAKNLSLIENNGTVYNICDQVARDRVTNVSNQLATGIAPISGIQKIAAGSKVLDFANSASCQIFTDGEMDDETGVEGCSNANTALLVSNGDWSAQSTATYNAFYANNAWHVHIGQLKTGQVRVNYLLIRF